jgi:Uri superfamily endonuclease
MGLGSIHMENTFPITGGLYILFCTLDESTRMQIGRLGTFDFKRGCYAYIGSAHGHGGLAARLDRHLRRPSDKRAHWHIDHFLSRAQIRVAAWAVNNHLSECGWSRSLACFGRRWPPHFGASDCRCAGHLIELEGQITIERITASIPEELHFRQLGMKA